MNENSLTKFTTEKCLMHMKMTKMHKMMTKDVGKWLKWVYKCKSEFFESTPYTVQCFKEIKKIENSKLQQSGKLQDNYLQSVRQKFNRIRAD